MIRIRVKLFGPYRDLFGGRELETELPPDSRLRDLLRRLGDAPERLRQLFAAADVLQPHVVVMKNGKPVQGPGGLESPLQNGDIIAIFPFLGGG